MNSIVLKQAIDHFLKEDIGSGDVTSDAIFGPDQPGTAQFIAKESFISAGMQKVAAEVFYSCNPQIICDGVNDSITANIGDVIFSASGPVLDLLKAERVALNLVQRLCGIATVTNKFVQQTANLPVKIVDTRKTTPGLRVLEKYAVRVGGGHNHRFNLSDGVLIKDNHISACGTITEAVKRVRNAIPHTLKIEVETESVEQLEECLACQVDIIMLDNMSIKDMHLAVKLVNGRAQLEASGGINLENIREIAETGVDIISIGALTHSAPACDISMRL